MVPRSSGIRFNGTTRTPSIMVAPLLKASGRPTAPAPLSTLDDADFRNRDDEMATPLPVFRLLRQNFVSEIPGQQKRVIRHCLQELLWRTDGKMDAGHVSPLLVRTSIDHEIQTFLTDAAVIQERAALGGCAVCDHLGRLALQIREKTAKRALDLLDTIRETAVEVKLVDAPGSFLIEQLRHGGRWINGVAVSKKQSN